MHMCIIMSMNIYINEDNEINLRKYAGSMSGLVNRLLDDFFTGSPVTSKGYFKPELENKQSPEKLKKWAESAVIPKDAVVLETAGELSEHTFGRKALKTCQHGYAIGLCKFGCKK